MKNSTCFLTILAFFIGFSAFSQEKTITYGLQFKPIIPTDIISNTSFQQTEKNVDFTLNSNFGYSFGMSIRRGFTDRFTLETGISYVSRNFDFSIFDVDLDVTENQNFTIIGYEIPIMALVFIQLDEKVFMDAAFGASIDFFPSDVGTATALHEHVSMRKGFFMPSLLANIGWEYRTYDKGFFYLGGSFHRPFTNIYLTGIQYERPTETVFTLFRTTGNYLTLDLRYYFPVEPFVKKTKEQKKDVKYYKKMQKKMQK